MSLTAVQTGECLASPSAPSSTHWPYFPKVSNPSKPISKWRWACHSLILIVKGSIALPNTVCVPEDSNVRSVSSIAVFLQLRL